MPVWRFWSTTIGGFTFLENDRNIIDADSAPVDTSVAEAEGFANGLGVGITLQE